MTKAIDPNLTRPLQDLLETIAAVKRNNEELDFLVKDWKTGSTTNMFRSFYYTGETTRDSRKATFSVRLVVRLICFALAALMFGYVAPRGPFSFLIDTLVTGAILSGVIGYALIWGDRSSFKAEVEAAKESKGEDIVKKILADWASSQS